MRKVLLSLLASFFITSLCYAGFETDKLGIIEGGVAPTFDTYFQGGDQAGDVTYTLPIALPGGAAFLKSSNAGVWTWDENTYLTTTTGDARYWILGTNQVGITGDKTGTFSIDTDGSGAFGTGITDDTLAIQFGHISWCASISGADLDITTGTGDYQSNSGDITLAAGIVTATEAFLTDFDSGSHGIAHALNDTINCGVLHDIVVTDEGGINISWATGIVWDCVAGATVTITASGSVGCTDNNINYLWWDRSGAGVTLTLGTAAPDYTDHDVLVAIIACQSNDIFEIHTPDILNRRENATSTAIREILRVVVTSGLVVTENVGGVAFDVGISAGTFYHFGTTRHNLAAAFNTTDDIAMTRWFHNAGVWTMDSNAQIDMTNWDDPDKIGGWGLDTLNAAKYYKSMFMYSENMIHWIYPQVEYDTIAQAIAAPLPVIPAVGEYFPRSVSVVMKGNDAAFPLATGERWNDIRPMFGTSIIGNVSDHASLINLPWSAAGHTMDATLDMNSNAITESATIGTAGDADLLTLAVNLLTVAGGIDITSTNYLRFSDTMEGRIHHDDTDLVIDPSFAGVGVLSILDGVKIAGDLWLASDTEKLALGATQTFEIYNDGSDGFITHTVGDLRLQHSAAGDVILFDTTDVADGDDGKSQYWWRMAAEGNSYIRMYVDNARYGVIASDQNLRLSSAHIRNLGSVYVGEHYGINNRTLIHYGYITEDAAQDHIQYVINDTTNNYELTKSGTNLGSFDIQMPLITDLITSSGGVALGNNIQLMLGAASYITYDGTDVVVLSDGAISLEATTSIDMNVSLDMTNHDIVGIGDLESSSAGGDFIIECKDQDNDILLKIDDGGTVRTAIQINGDVGSVTMPRQSYVYAYRNGDVTIANNTVTTLVFNVEYADTLGEFATGTGIFTAKDDGKYVISTHVLWKNINSNVVYETKITQTGVGGTPSDYHYSAFTGAWFSERVTATLDLSAGDTARVQVFQTSGGNEVVRGSALYTYITIQKVA